MSIGRMGSKGTRSTNPLVHVRMVVRDSDGNETFGCAADRLSVRWLDKRPGREKSLKLHELIDLIYAARDIYLSGAEEFENPFDEWRVRHAKITQAGEDRKQEALTSAFASALFERALLDAVCRLAGKPIFDMVREGRLGFRPALFHPETKDLRAADYAAAEPLTAFNIRHTVGNADALTEADLPPEARINDGLPETLAEYIREDGLRYFKLKLSGDRKHDLRRVARVWEILPTRRGQRWANGGRYVGRCMANRRRTY